MEEYRAPYLILREGRTRAIAALERQNYGVARDLLLAAQQNAEEAYIQTELEAGEDQA